eukprot:TRINITY_DN176_c3_g1_i2.p2 TRINITY_DN176_c3_g1~~TRINITY_DN176_c3_g1_i2.p2  ORF type:complete len:470 (+),score=189.78 TRINITY_DN176_c3_g1_i2:1671-3080(+)
MKGRNTKIVSKVRLMLIRRKSLRSRRKRGRKWKMRRRKRKRRSRKKLDEEQKKRREEEEKKKEEEAKKKQEAEKKKEKEEEKQREEKKRKDEEEEKRKAVEKELQEEKMKTEEKSKPKDPMEIDMDLGDSDDEAGGGGGGGAGGAVAKSKLLTTLESSDESTVDLVPVKRKRGVTVTKLDVSPSPTPTKKRKLSPSVTGESAWTGKCKYEDGLEFPLDLKMTIDAGGAVSGTVEWTTLGTQTKIRGNLDGTVLNVEEYEAIIGGDEVEIPSFYLLELLGNSITGKVKDDESPASVSLSKVEPSTAAAPSFSFPTPKTFVPQTAPDATQLTQLLTPPQSEEEKEEEKIGEEESEEFPMMIKPPLSASPAIQPEPNSESADTQPLEVSSPPPVSPKPTKPAESAATNESDAPFKNLGEFLKSIKLLKHLALFEEEEIDLEAAAELGEPDLKELGLPMGARKKFMKAQSILK